MPVTNPAQLTSVVAIFGGPGNLRSYLAGGTYVPPGTTGVNGAVPSSGSLPLSKLAGTVNFTPGTVTYTSSSGSFTVPSGTVTLVIEAVGGAGAGGYGSYDSVADQAYGGGGGSAAVRRQHGGRLSPCLLCCAGVVPQRPSTSHQCSTAAECAWHDAARGVDVRRTAGPRRWSH